MASSKDYLLYVLELLRNVKDISYRKMMGEYILYKSDTIFGGVYDNRFLVKKTQSAGCFNLKEELPYEGGSKMLLIDSENAEEVEDIVITVCNDLIKDKHK